MASDPSSPSTPTDGLTVWQKIERRLEGLLRDPRRPIKTETYHKIYDRVYGFCTGQLPGGPGLAVQPAFSRNTGANLHGGEIYESLRLFLCNHLEKTKHQAESYHGDDLLTFYNSEWERFTVAAQYIQHLFQYLDRYWVPREFDDGRDNVYPIYVLHLVCWKDVVFHHMHERVMGAILNLVERHRNGEAVNYNLIKAVVSSFATLDIDNVRTDRQALSSFTTYFEKPYLEATRQYYLDDSQQFLSCHTVTEYMARAEIQLTEEKERASLYLLDAISGPLMSTCENALVFTHAELLYKEFSLLLNQDRQYDLHRMFLLLGRISDGHDPLRAQLEDYVKKAGLNAIERISSGDKMVDPKVYVDTLIGIHARYQALVNKAFEGQTDFVRSLDNACSEFVNRNAVCKGDSKKSPELLAKYTDSLLKRAPSHSLDIDDYKKSLDMVITIFKFLRDKDVFQDIYRRSLAKRLVYGISASDDAEMMMIANLKDECGFEYSNKLQRMFQDIQTSKDLTSEYRISGPPMSFMATEPVPPDSTFTILGPEFRHFPSPSSPFTPPQALSGSIDHFGQFYDGKHQNRRLTWLWQLSKGELHATYLKNLTYTPIFQLSAYQMGILLLFNDVDSLLWTDIQTQTQLGDDLLDSLLAVFVSFKVLNQTGNGRTNWEYALNMNFVPRKARTNLNITIKSEQKKEVKVARKTVDQDRKIVIQSAIVRIMKAAQSKAFSTSELVNQTVDLLTSDRSKASFKPDVADIKQAIETLVDKEYLEKRSEDELVYVP